MSDVFDEILDDELTEDDLDELEALGAAEDADFLLGIQMPEARIVWRKFKLPETGSFTEGVAAVMKRYGYKIIA
ncbi:hypothetical protein EV644_107334 [Kribbella orskensis]|uniref:Uncharacterized protein n=1 Tax=Kribbella orskensis TaxID=2512216 RepID=A0ABY2BJJ1_9ACTN|nr:MULTISPECIES: hypothetical protein [Kribbella]TCN39362.1 hypothetical protein EV642_107334 [Kribbella sp. VKM Ac-2500]TCO22009.1 hypothetical protein EV644_107334 [Kribbella orskensis]